jgi:hypothetical protein
VKGKTMSTAEIALAHRPKMLSRDQVLYENQELRRRQQALELDIRSARLAERELWEQKVELTLTVNKAFAQNVAKYVAKNSVSFETAVTKAYKIEKLLEQLDALK